jgi:hypothetical protein
VVLEKFSENRPRFLAEDIFDQKFQELLAAKNIINQQPKIKPRQPKGYDRSYRNITDH